MNSRAATNARTAGETLATVAIGAAAGIFAVWAREQADKHLSNLAGEEARAQTAAARLDGQLPGEKIVSMVERAAGVEQAPEVHAAAGEIVQYALAAAPVIAYALLRDRLPGRGAARGLVFGETMFVLQDQLLNTLTGLNGKLSAYPWTAHAQGAAAHAVYGVAAELAISLFEAAGKRLGGDPAAAPEGSGEERVAMMDVPSGTTCGIRPPPVHGADRMPSMGARASEGAVHAS